MSVSMIYPLLNKKSQQREQDELVLSVVVPFFNEDVVLPLFHQRLTKVLDALEVSSEIIYVDDGSSDSSVELIRQFNVTRSQVRCLCLSRNFGKESAMSAGLAYCQGQAVIVIDADLQDPPELIPDMLKQWQQGFDIVNMQRSVRHGESWFKRFSAACFYKMLNLMSNMKVPENVGDFRLLSRTVVQHINSLPEKNRYMKGIFTWPGFKQTTLQFERDARFCGETKWNYLKLLGLAMDGLTSFSIRPLRIATVLGTLITGSALLIGLWAIINALLAGDFAAGYPSMMVIQLGLGGIQLLCIGLLGEYVGRIFIETKQRPIYLVQSIFDQPPHVLDPKPTPVHGKRKLG